MNTTPIDPEPSKPQELGKYTRCPFCIAVFRITRAKLEMRDGEVRCGACREIFNGYNHGVTKDDSGAFTPYQWSPNDIVSEEVSPVTQPATQNSGAGAQIGPERSDDPEPIDSPEIQSVRSDELIEPHLDILQFDSRNGDQQPESSSDSEQLDGSEASDKTDLEDATEPLKFSENTGQEDRVDSMDISDNVDQEDQLPQVKNIILSNLSKLTHSEPDELESTDIGLDESINSVPMSDRLVTHPAKSIASLGKVEPDLGIKPLAEQNLEKTPVETYLNGKLEDADTVRGNDPQNQPLGANIGNWFNAEPDPQMDNNPFEPRAGKIELEEPKPSVINMNGVDEYIVDRPNPLLSIFWFLICIGFIVLLGFQVKHYHVEKFAQDEQYRPALRLFCKVAKCTLPARRDPFRFTITNTRIDLHPQEPGALRITVKLLNQADFAQEFPELQLTLTDRVGRVVGRRTFDPTFYLGSNQLNQLDSGDLGLVVFDLVHPHEKAVGFVIDIVRES